MFAKININFLMINNSNATAFILPVQGMLLLKLGPWFLVVALAHAFDIESKLKGTEINLVEQNGFIFDPTVHSPMAVHTAKLKGNAHLSQDHGLLFALPEGKTGIFTISNKHCMKAPKTETVKSCLCYQGTLSDSFNAQGLTTCYARDMVPLCIEASFNSVNKTTSYAVIYVNEQGSVVNEPSNLSTVKLSFTANSAQVIIDHKALPAVKPNLETMNLIYFSNVKVNALNVKSHDCVSFEFEEVVYGGQLISYTAFPRNTYGSDCIGACHCNFKSLTWRGGAPIPGEAKDEVSTGHSPSTLTAVIGAVCTTIAFTTVLAA